MSPEPNATKPVPGTDSLRARRILHDLNNALNAMTLLTDSVQQALGSDHAVGEDLEGISRLAVLCGELSRQLRHPGVSRPTTPLDLNAVLHESASVLRGVVDGDLLLPPPGQPAQVYLTPCEANQILLNLLTNANAAIAADGMVSITLANELIPVGGGPSLRPLPTGLYVRMEVLDDGIGMDAETLAHALEPGFSSRRGRGHGLGLPSVQSIVVDAGGALAIESEPRWGTCVRMWLPLAC